MSDLNPISARHRVALHVGCGAFATLAGALLMLVSHADRDPAQAHTAPYAYMITVFPFFGFALAELIVRWRTRDVRAMSFAIQLVVLATLAFARLRFGIPASGHVMMQVWFVVAVWQFEPRRLAVVEFVLGLGALVTYVAIKLFAWHDTTSPLWGLVLGALVLVVGRALTFERSATAT